MSYFNFTERGTGEGFHGLSVLQYRGYWEMYDWSIYQVANLLSGFEIDHTPSIYGYSKEEIEKGENIAIGWAQEELTGIKHNQAVALNLVKNVPSSTPDEPDELERRYRTEHLVPALRPLAHQGLGVSHDYPPNFFEAMPTIRPRPQNDQRGQHNVKKRNQTWAVALGCLIHKREECLDPKTQEVSLPRLRIAMERHFKNWVDDDYDGVPATWFKQGEHYEWLKKAVKHSPEY